MDLGEEGSKSNLEDGKDEERSDIAEKMAPLDANGDEINGEMGFEDNSNPNHRIGEDERIEEFTEAIGSPPLAPKVNEDGTEDNHEGELSPKSIGSSSNSNLEVNSAPTKGYGLKKWRRIRRDSSKEASGGADNSLIHKRRLSLIEPSKTRNDEKTKNVIEGEMETPTASIGSLRSTEAVVETVALDPELVKFVASGAFSIGMDSDNSGDRSSKSSTAASVPKPRHETGFGRERETAKNMRGRGTRNALQQRTQRGRGSGVDASKKIRGDWVSLEKENSQSSVESDFRSSNTGFMRWGSEVSNGKLSESSLNFDGEHGDEAQASDEVRSGYNKENGVVEDLLREDLDADVEGENEAQRENFRPPSGVDPFVESIAMLQVAQEALETEIKQFTDIGNPMECNDFDIQSEETEVNSFPTLESHYHELNRKIEDLQYKLEEASATAKAKELNVIELENIIKRTQSPNEATFNSEEIHDLEFELEGLLKKKIEAEIEFLIITKTAKNWKILAEDQIALFEEQKSLAGDQAQMILKLRDTEDKVIHLKEQAEKLESYSEELLGAERVLKLQNKVCKFSFCCFIQLLLLCVAFGLFLIQMKPPSHEFVPT